MERKMGLGLGGKTLYTPPYYCGCAHFSLAPSPQIHLKSTNFRSRSTSSYRLAVPFPNSRFLNKYAHNHRIGSRYIGSVDQIQRAYQSQNLPAESYHLPSSIVCHRLRRIWLSPPPLLFEPIRVSSPVKYSYFDQRRRSICLA